MTPEDAAHHEWLSEIRHQRPEIVGLHSRRILEKLKSTGDHSNDNDHGKSLRNIILLNDLRQPVLLLGTSLHCVPIERKPKFKSV